jgi:hypothetical protein
MPSQRSIQPEYRPRGAEGSGGNRARTRVLAPGDLAQRLRAHRNWRPTDDAPFRTVSSDCKVKMVEFA